MNDKIEPMKIGASVAVSVLRLAWQKHMTNVKRGAAYDGERAKATRRATDEVLECRNECIPTLSDEAALRIAQGDATLRGWSHLGFTYHDAPDDVVGEYISERDDSSRTTWVAPVWAKTADGWQCTIAGMLVTAWTVEQWADYGSTGVREFVHLAVVSPPADMPSPEALDAWSKALDAPAPHATDAATVLATQMAHTLARDPSTVEGSTVVVHDGEGNVLATATAPTAETRDAVMTSFENVVGAPLDKQHTEIAAHVAMVNDEVRADVETMQDALEVEPTVTLAGLLDDIKNEGKS